ICTLLGICLVLTGCGRTKVVLPEVEIGAAEPAQPQAGEPFQFAKDVAGGLLAKTLTPVENRRLLSEPVGGPKPFPSPRGLTAPLAAVAPGNAIMPSVPPKPVAHDLRPRLVTDETVFNPREELSLPQAVSFPAPERVRLAGADVNQPVPLPVLATQSQDRVP